MFARAGVSVRCRRRARVPRVRAGGGVGWGGVGWGVTRGGRVRAGGVRRLRGRRLRAVLAPRVPLPRTEPAARPLSLSLARACARAMAAVARARVSVPGGGAAAAACGRAGGRRRRRPVAVVRGAPGDGEREGDAETERAGGLLSSLPAPAARAGLPPAAPERTAGRAGLGAVGVASPAGGTKGSWAPFAALIAPLRSLSRSELARRAAFSLLFIVVVRAGLFTPLTGDAGVYLRAAAAVPPEAAAAAANAASTASGASFPGGLAGLSSGALLSAISGAGGGPAASALAGDKGYEVSRAYWPRGAACVPRARSRPPRARSDASPPPPLHPHP